MDGSVLEEKLSFKMLDITFSAKLKWGSYIVAIAKTACKKFEVLIRSMNCLSPEIAYYLLNLPYDLAWNIVVVSGLMLLAAI